MKTKSKAPEVFGYAMGRSTLGAILVAMSELGVVSILSGSDPDRLLTELRERFPKVRLVEGQPTAQLALARVIAHAEQPAAALTLPLDIRTSPFQRRVWEAVHRIPPGQTSTYKDIARQIGSPLAMRAVGNACSNNHFAYAIPCHRVLHSGGVSRASERQRLWLAREAGVG
jgi:AraC family transcriptional regulator of adaptative response/methylated-DNA-[protein]-cysteine methyltransferase